MPKIKICCISSAVEAQLAIRAGADALGLVSAMPSGPGVIGEDIIADIARRVPPPVGTFLLTSEVGAEAVIAQHERCGTNTIQLVDATSSDVRLQLRNRLSGISIVQVIHVLNETSIEEALACCDTVDALLLDSGNPNLAVKELGGTGRTHNWTVSRQIVDAATVPVFLAGGLQADNVAAAIDAVQPFGLDICSGVRTNGHLDPKKLDAFIETARA